MREKKLLTYLLLLFFAATLSAETLSEINKKINTTEKTIKKQDKTQKKIKDSIDDLARQIIKARSKLKVLAKNQKKLEDDIVVLSKDSTSKQKEIKDLEIEKEKLVKEQQTVEIKLIDLLSSNISKTMILEKMQESGTKDVIKKEIFKKVREQTAEEINKIKLDFIFKQQKVTELENRIKVISRSLNSLIDKREKVEKLKQEQNVLVASLSRKQDRYSKKLSDIINKKQETRQFLAKLGIIKEQELKKVQEKERQERLARADRERLRNTKSSDTKVRQIGSSYLAVGKNHYRGKKVKPPIDDQHNFAVTKQFGPFVDPIYDIKIHNDYVTLRSEDENSVIRNVLDGKVVFADNLPMLGKVVIIRHNNGIHTIYRKLNQISPNVNVKSKIKEREAIGRIDRELEFEVTKDNIPINPLELISVPKKYISSL